MQRVFGPKVGIPRLLLPKNPDLGLLAPVDAIVIPRELDLADPIGRSAGSFLPLIELVGTLVEPGKSSSSV